MEYLESSWCAHCGSEVIMEIEVNPELLRLIATVEKDVARAVHEALALWLKKKIPICPVTNRFCVNVHGACNECPIAIKESFQK